MSNTFTEIHIQVVFAVRNREYLIAKNWRGRLYKYIIAIVQKRKHKVVSIGGTDDHIHMLLGLRPTQSLASLMQEVKRDSAEWINQNRLIAGKFEWQEGYGGFSYSKSQIPQVARYIENQEKHHETRSVSFAEEFKKFLDEWKVEYDTRYIFQDVTGHGDASLRDAG